MPIYEYRCADCGFQNEYLQKVSEPPMTRCPSCGQEAFRKLLTAAGFQLKGSGWYVTDFRNSGKAAAKSAPGEGAKAADTGTKAAEAGTEAGASKSESKTEAPSSPSSDKGTTSACTSG